MLKIQKVGADNAIDKSTTGSPSARMRWGNNRKKERAMSDYEPFEPTQGDPWSTEPVGDAPQRRRAPDPGSFPDDTQVLARMPHVDDEPSSDYYRRHGRSSGSSHRRHRSSQARPGIPAPVWIVVGMGLVVLIASPFLMSRNSGDEASLEMPSPDADLAPTWSPGDANSQWQQPGVWSPEPTATATAEPTAPVGLNPTSDWVGAPANAPYGYNANMAAPMAVDQQAANLGAGMSADPSGRPVPATPGVGWDTSIAPMAANHSGGPVYDDGARLSPPGYPVTAGSPPTGWTDRAAAPGAPSASSYDAMQPGPNASPWDQSPNTPSLATPQPEKVMPGYGTYPSVQTNPYVESASAPAPYVVDNPYAGAAAPPATPQQYPGGAPNYPVAGQSSASLYPTVGYPQTAMSPQPPSPTYSQPAASPSAYSTQPVASPPVYSPTNPYAPQTAPAPPARQPYYGAGASADASQRSVARLNGTIQEPAARNAYDDRARPSYY